MANLTTSSDGPKLTPLGRVFIFLFVLGCIAGAYYLFAGKKSLHIEEADFASLESRMPLLLTPGAAETLAVKIYRLVRTSNSSPLDALRTCLTDYQNPVPLETLEFQIRLAVTEASDLEFVPSGFRGVQPAYTYQTKQSNQ